MEQKLKIKNNFFHYENDEVKNQIILTNTNRSCRNYLLGLKYRNNKNYKKIPHILIDKKGIITPFIGTSKSSQFFGDKTIDQQSIFIVLENLGWLQKNPVIDRYTNWIGDIYKGKPFEKKWRGNFFWDVYTNDQIKSCAEVIDYLSLKHNIEKDFIGHNTKIEGVENFKGIVTRSNYSVYWNDVTPAFDFEKLKLHLNEEQEENINH